MPEARRDLSMVNLGSKYFTFPPRNFFRDSTGAEHVANQMQAIPASVPDGVSEKILPLAN
jgi:hypothetical protein